MIKYIQYGHRTQGQHTFLDAGVVVAPRETRWTTHPMKNWVQMSILIHTHTHAPTLQENVRRFTSHKTRLSGESREGLKTVCKSWEGRLARAFMVFGRGLEQGAPTQAGDHRMTSDRKMKQLKAK